MAQAYVASLRATCGSRRVGAVIVNGLEPGKRRVLATGYNGTPPGDSHCIEGGCPRLQARNDGLIKSGEYDERYPCYAFHAEANAIYQMLQMGVPTADCVLFTTVFPCKACAEKVLGSGIKTVFYSEGYPDKKSIDYFEKYKIKYHRIPFQ